MRKLLPGLFAMLIIFGTGPRAFAQPEGGFMTNAQLFRGQLTALTDSIIAKSSLRNGQPLSLAVLTSDEHAFITQAITAAIRSHGVPVYLDSVPSGSSYVLTASGVEMNVTYGETFDKTITGEGKTSRSVSVVLPYTLVESGSGKVLLGEILRSQRTDTVLTASISSLEQKQIPSTVAPLPEQGFFNRVLEALVIIGATGVAIFLFFQIRS